MQEVNAYVTISGFTHKVTKTKFKVEIRSGIIKTSNSLAKAAAQFQRDLADDVIHEVAASYSVRYRLSLIWDYDFHNSLIGEFRGTAEDAVSKFLALNDRYTITEIE